jgi:biopolymer transport protein ExbD
MAERTPSDRRHRSAQAARDTEPLDLDVTPFLNIMFMLILSILAMTAWTELAMLNVQAPPIGGGSERGAEAPSLRLNLTVFILQDGFNIGASGATLDGDGEARPGEPLITNIEVKYRGKNAIEYDYAKLQRRLIEIKKSFPLEKSMIISADADVSYDVVIQTMDAARKSADGKLLFPAVAFAAGVVG